MSDIDRRGFLGAVAAVAVGGALPAAEAVPALWWTEIPMLPIPAPKPNGKIYTYKALGSILKVRASNNDRYSGPGGDEDPYDWEIVGWVDAESRKVTFFEWANVSVEEANSEDATCR